MKQVDQYAYDAHGVLVIKAGFGVAQFSTKV